MRTVQWWDDRRRLLDGFVGVVAGVAFVLPVVGRGVAAGLSLLLALSLMVRRTEPRLAFGTGVLAAVLLVVSTPIPVPAVVAVPVLVYSLARGADLRLARAALVCGLVGSVLGPLRWALGTSVGYAGLMLLACVASVVGAYVLGRRLREAQDNVAQRTAAAAERQRLLEAEHEQRARVVAVSERNRVARELHDIIAHSLSVIVVQADGGRALCARRPEAAPEVLATIAETGREALGEVRRMVDLLRGGEASAADYGPTPGLAEIPELVRRTAANAELVTFGTPAPVHPAVGLTAYRVVQESLTNVLKHAGPGARARVTLAHTGGALEIEVVDDGCGPATAEDGAGHGLPGMAERLAVHGGRLQAGPRPGGGFAVRAWLPLTPTQAAAATGVGPTPGRTNR